MNHKRLLKKFEKDLMPMTGNVVSNCQLSSFIRPINRTECNGHEFPKGYLRKNDLECFKPYKISPYMMRAIDDNPNIDLILYVIRDCDRGKVHIHGYVLTDEKNNLIRSEAAPGKYDIVKWFYENLK